MTHRRLHPATILFVAAASLVGIAYACLIWQQLRYGLEYDESYNLTVVKNLAEGHGYATTGISYGWYKAFDPAASTGPAMLLPGAALWKLTGGVLWVVRLVPILYFLLYLGSLGWLFTSIAGRWAGLLAAASPLVLSVGTADISTVSLVPGRYVGEFTAVALTVLMAALLYRRQPFLAGLAGGLALQAKLTFALPLLVVMGAWLLGCWLRKDLRRGATLVRLALGAAVPTLLFEVFRFTQVGASGYVPSLKEYVAWVIGYGTTGTDDHLASTGRRLAGLAETLSPLGAILLLGALAILALAAVAPRMIGRLPDDEGSLRRNPRSFDPIVGLLGPAVVMLLWWTLVPPEKLPRVGLPIILLGVPVLAVLTFIALADLRAASRGRPRLVITWAAVAMSLGVASLVAVQAWTAIGNDFGHRLYSEQQAGSQAIIDSGTPSIPSVWIWNLAQFQILTGIPSETRPGVAKPTVQVFDSIRARTDHGVDDARAFLDECSTVLYASQSVVVCQ